MIKYGNDDNEDETDKDNNDDADVTDCYGVGGGHSTQRVKSLSV